MKFSTTVMLALAGVGGAWLGWSSSPPSEQVLVAAHTLTPGQRISAADLRPGRMVVPKGHGRLLLPVTLGGLVAGEYVTHPVFTGAPVLSSDIHPATRNYVPPKPIPASDCTPASSV